jgi:5-methylcytosine-specific restriction endonuclease McrA
MTARKMPTKLSIKNHWAAYLIKINKFDSYEELFEAEYCFACGMNSDGDIERAHIKARCEGGSDNVENLHLLCGFCHKQSEFINGKKYKTWFMEQNGLTMMLAAISRGKE